jgi:hypothetical protein
LLNLDEPLSELWPDTEQLLKEALRLSLNALKALQAKAVPVDSDGSSEPYKAASLCENAPADISSASDMLVSHPACGWWKKLTAWYHSNGQTSSSKSRKES